ncbi:MAG: DUF1697 domain-containing protein [Candidatus Eisenbacteria bacterium]
MKRYAAFLRGVTPMNVRMPELARAFESAGFAEVRTVLSSGNVVFDVAAATPTALESRAETAMKTHLGRAFFTIVRPVDTLRALIESDPYASFRLKPGSKRVVTFLRARPRTAPCLPIELHGARILRVAGLEAYSAYLPTPRGPVFMNLIERTFGTEVTTRTWDTVTKVAR